MSARLKEDIQALIRQIPSRTPEQEARSHRRWMSISGGQDAGEAEDLPLVVMGYDRNRPDEYKSLWPGHIRYPLGERIDDPEKMLYEQLAQLVPAGRYPSDATLCVMPMMGNAFLLSALSVETMVVGDTLEPARHLPWDAIRRLELKDGLEHDVYIRKNIQFLQYAQSTLPSHIQTGLCFLMSPYDLAYLIRGHELMLDMYVAPDDVHWLLQLCTELFVRAVRLLKQAAGEPDGYFRYQLRTYRGGSILCEDCCVMLSPQLHREFSIPYTKEALDALGGGWVHFCGDGRHLLDNYFALPNMHGIQYGQLELNGVVDETVRRHLDRGRALHYSLPKADGESWPAFFGRVASMARTQRHMDLAVSVFTDAGVGEDLMEMWHDAQRV